MRLRHCHTDGASVRRRSQCLRNFGAHKDFDRVAVWFQQIQTDLGRARADNRTGRLMAPDKGSKERHSFP